MYKLYLDTSTKFLCVGITLDDQIIYQYEQIAEKKQSEMAIPVLQEALKQSHIELKDIQEVCVTIGPGSFTGIRIGMCIAKTLAYANQIPLKAITSLNAYATNQDSVVVLDAKANRCYLGIYHQHKPVIQECVVPLTKAQEIIKSFSNYDSILDAHLLNLPAKPVQNVIQQMIIIANKTQPIENIDALVPLYLKDE